MQQLAPFEIARPQQEAADVKPIDQFPIYELGASLQSLRATCDDGKATSMDQLSALWNAGLRLDGLLQGAYIDVSFCREAAEVLRRGIDASAKEFTDPATSAWNTQKPALPTWRLYGIRTQLEKFEHQFSAELKKQTAYAVPAQGIFQTEMLVDKADMHIHVSIRPSLPEFALGEFRKAGRCLAFSLFSASGYHSARAVESVLRVYYALHIGGPPKKDDAGLGLMASHLENLKDKKPKPKKVPNENTIRHLREFTKMDRNPVIHPNQEVDLEEIDALTMFHTALGVIVEMGKEIAANGNRKADQLRDATVDPLAGTVVNRITNPDAA